MNIPLERTLPFSGRLSTTPSRRGERKARQAPAQEYRIARVQMRVIPGLVGAIAFEDDELGASVLLATFLSGVVGDWLGDSVSFGC